MKYLFFLTFIGLIHTSLQSQSPYMLRGDQAYHTYDRMEIMRALDTTLNNGINNYSREELVKILRRIKPTHDLTTKDIYDLKHILNDNIEFLDNNGLQQEILLDSLGFRTEKEESVLDFQSIFNRNNFERTPVWKHFYKTKANFLELETQDFKLYINPILQVSYHNQVNNENFIFQNTRGIEVRSYIDDKVYLYTQLLENQRSYLDYVDERATKFRAIPSQAFYKRYNSSVIDNLRGYDFFHTRAFVGFNATKSIQMEMGHGNHFIGNGIRSLLLGDLGPNYFYMSVNTRMWKFHYQNIFAELSPTTPQAISGDRELPKKFKSTHYLSYKHSSKFEIGIFESVVFGRQNGFELQYLNPVILYRAVEHYLGSPDNVIVGLNVKYNAVKNVSLYGQVILNEFKLNEMLAGTGWWANKYGLQGGLKYINALGIDHLDMQMEYNTIRPYTFTHRGMQEVTGYSIANYSHYHQPLAHPLGANFKETILMARYKPHDKVYLQGRFLHTIYGEDAQGENWGGNILLPYENRQQEFGNFTGQGTQHKINAFYIDATYEFRHNYFLDIQAMWRQTTTDITRNQHYLGGGFRVNISHLHYDY